jgi:hypothetical protein
MKPEGEIEALEVPEKFGRVNSYDELVERRMKEANQKDAPIERDQVRGLPLLAEERLGQI